MSIAKNLKQILEDKQLTVSELARKTGVPKSTLLSWLSEKRSSPDLYQLQKVCEFLGTNIDAVAFNKKSDDIISQLIDKIEVHSGLYEITVKKVVQKK